MNRPSFTKLNRSYCAPGLKNRILPWPCMRHARASGGALTGVNDAFDSRRQSARLGALHPFPPEPRRRHVEKLGKSRGSPQPPPRLRLVVTPLFFQGQGLQGASTY